MSNIFTRQNFDPSVIPNHLKPDEKDVITVAVGVGWTVNIGTRNSLTIVSPDGHKKHYFGTSSGNRRMPASKILKDVMRRGKPELVETLDSVLGLPKNKQIEALRLAGIPRIGDPGTVVDHTPEIEAEREREKREREERRAAKVSKAAKVKQEAKEVVATSKDEGRRIVSTKPMIAKSAENKGYESPTTMERLWSDGQRDYACRFEGCTYIGATRGAVPTHYASVHSRGKGRAAQPRGFETDVSEARRYRPRPQRVEALGEVIKALLESGETDAVKIAREALVWVHDNPRSNGVDEGEERERDEPQTPEAILEKIRDMLDGGALAAARKREEELEQRLIEAEAKAEKARSTLKTFLDLAREEAELDDEQEAS